MDGDEPTGPDRREFMKRVGGAAIYGVPVVAALGAARPLGGTESPSNPEQVAKHLQEAAVQLNAAYSLGAEYRWAERDMEVLRPAVSALQRPIRGWPPEWCTIC